MSFFKKLIKGVGKLAKGDVLGAVSSVASGVIGSKSNKKAAKAVQDGADAQIAE